MPVTVDIPERVIQAFPTQERDALRKLVELITDAVNTSVSSLTLNDLSDVVVPSPAENDVLTFTDPDWTAEAGGGGGATSETYTPTVTAWSNCSEASLPYDCTVSVVGDLVTVNYVVRAVAGTTDNNPTCSVILSLPYPASGASLGKDTGSGACKRGDETMVSCYSFISDTEEAIIVWPAIDTVIGCSLQGSFSYMKQL
jgi:hypothetical protein